jgi:tRNA(Ile)-lysidine synthase TilS/MesJ
MDLPIARPPWKKGGKHLESLCRKALLKFSMIPEGPIGVALSGGKDSLSLLFLLHAIKGHGVFDFPLYAIHVEGEFSCGAGIEKSFLQSVCKELDVPFLVKQSLQKKEELECYSCSRERRRLIFEAAKENGISTLAFGHHREDQNQTLLLNLFQKGEFAALLPKIYLYHYQVTIIRPLILIPEKEIIQFAKTYGFSRFSCQCPIGQTSKRKVVEKILTSIEEDFPHIRKNLSHSAFLYGSDKASKP